MYYEEISLKFTGSELPYIEVSIDGLCYPMCIDLGSCLEMSIQSDTLRGINKSPLGEKTWRNFKGTEFYRSTYQIPSVKIGSLTFNIPVVTESLKEENSEAIIWKSSTQNGKPKETVGSLGRKFFKNTNLLFDVKKSTVIATDDFYRLKSKGYDLRKYSRVPFTMTSDGIVLNIATDLGGLDILVDTGFTLTMLHDFLYPYGETVRLDYRGIPIFSSRKFIIGNKDFGRKNLYFLKMQDRLYDIDGFLGMDFIKDHVIYIDLSKSEIYIQ